MLYVDSSALVKHYLHEAGSDALKLRLQEAARAEEPVLTSFLSYAEIHAVLARKLRENLLGAAEFHGAATRFNSDWRSYLAKVEVSQAVLALIPKLVKTYPLKASDAVQLASALWAVRAIPVGERRQQGQKEFAFVTSDKQLAVAAEREQLSIFNPSAI